ncbi:C40 family peptidase [Bordetella bronchialis]|uniref:NlpC/P60 family protein 2 n=1 Tax=Bordetella bronchialis TaxID=463025 RepID=A0A193FHY7_9BORD|nr:C40 family peptidase [Bordetella bronchialis]ANN67357.1 NlpC/P60 family protein 2 [Bordetella bronchialis]ANN72447.1 NlpC/P60 family protein 2 [Bordetella bronchialis]
MTPPTRRYPFSRIFLPAALLTIALATLPGTAGAMISSDALGSLKGLSPTDLPTVPSLRDRVVAAGLDALGTRYRYGGDDPDTGFDCSGLVSFIYKEVAGMDLPRRARDQRAEGRAVKTAQLQPGDLVFFGIRRHNQTSHVGIYIGNNEFIHAPTRGEKVRIDTLDSAYWSKRFNGARRYIAPGDGGATAVASNAR